MKKVILALALSAVAVSSFADGRRYEDHRYEGHRSGEYHNTGGGWVAPLIIGGSLGYILGRPQPPQVVVQQPPQVIYQPQPQTVYVYPTNAPVVQTPGMYCELRSEMVNGQVVTGNFCYQR